MEEEYFEDEFKYFSVVNTYMPTSIAVLRLSNERAIGIADERTLYGRDQGNIASKIAIKGNCAVLSAGDGSATEEITRLFNEKDDEKNFNQILDSLTESFHNIYKSRVQGVIFSKHGTDWIEYQTGKLKNGKPMSQEFQNLLQREVENYTREQMQVPSPRFEVGLLYTGYNENRDDMEIYKLSGAGVAEICPDKFGAVGSGASAINKEFFDFLESLPAEKRNNIELADGFYAITKAYLNSVKRAFGVDGGPTIVDVGKDYARKIDSVKSRVMRNLVVKEEEIGTEKVKTYLTDLATDKIDALTVAKEISKPEDIINHSFY